jgi:hypothetical protein
MAQVCTPCGESLHVVNSLHPDDRGTRFGSGSACDLMQSRREYVCSPPRHSRPICPAAETAPVGFVDRLRYDTTGQPRCSAPVGAVLVAPTGHRRSLPAGTSIDLRRPVLVAADRHVADLAENESPRGAADSDPCGHLAFEGAGLGVDVASVLRGRVLRASGVAGEVICGVRIGPFPQAKVLGRSPVRWRAIVLPWSHVTLRVIAPARAKYAASLVQRRGRRARREGVATSRIRWPAQPRFSVAVRRCRLPLWGPVVSGRPTVCLRLWSACCCSAGVAAPGSVDPPVFQRPRREKIHPIQSRVSVESLEAGSGKSKTGFYIPIRRNLTG